VKGDGEHSPEWLQLTLRFLSAEVRAPGIGTEAVVSRAHHIRQHIRS
jgi:hypothetical protein